MKATPWLLAALIAAAGCEDKASTPAPTQEKKTETTKPETKPAEKAEEGKEGDTKPAKTEDTAEVAKLLNERTTKLMEALKSKNVDAIIAFVPEKEREEAKKAFGAGGQAHKSFFTAGEWRAKAIETWDTKIQMIRLQGEEARVKVGETEKKEAAVVQWMKQDGEWYFKDMLSPAADEFASWGEEIK
ncbi:MAG TPA: hypothetical protein VFB62_27945 [Polyangiaceae bacterium]|nr:hypothetical protein [Polyangiaceae bacterium]